MAPNVPVLAGEGGGGQLFNRVRLALNRLLRCPAVGWMSPGSMSFCSASPRVELGERDCRGHLRICPLDELPLIVGTGRSSHCKKEHMCAPLRPWHGPDQHQLPWSKDLRGGDCHALRSDQSPAAVGSGCNGQGFHPRLADRNAACNHAGTRWQR